MTENHTCPTCIHRGICKYSVRFEETQNSLDAIMYIEPVALQCSYWCKEMTVNDV